MKKLIYSFFILSMAMLTFSSCEDVPDPFGIPTESNDNKEPVEINAKGAGTLNDPYNPAGAAAAVKDLTWTSNDVYETTGEVYVKGKISRIADKGTFTEGGTYGNASFYISEDGSEVGEFYCFRVLYLGNKKFESGNTDIKVGDEVIVCGQLMNYRNNTPETVASKAYLYSLNGKTAGGGGTPEGDAKGTGTIEDPYNPAGAAAAVKNLTWTSNDVYDTTGEVYVKGKISRIAGKGTFTEGGTYGNASFYISEDGKKGNEFYCFRVLYLGNKKFESGNTDIKVGDEVIVCGQLMNYRGNTPETVASKAYLYSLNGKTAGGDTPTPEKVEPKGSGTEKDPYNVAAALDLISTLGADKNSDDIYVKGIISSISEIDTGQYGNATISDTGQEANQLEIYRGYSLNGDKFTSSDEIKVGDEVVVYGKVVNFRGNTPEFTQGSKIVTINKGGTNTKGTYDKPFSVAEAIANNSGTGVYVKAYIVGWVEYIKDEPYSSSARFNNNSTLNTNIMIADSPNETDASKCMPVQLPNGPVRDGINLKDNPSLYKQEVLLLGNLDAYFSTPGIKSVTYAEVGGSSFGTK